MNDARKLEKLRVPDKAHQDCRGKHDHETPQQGFVILHIGCRAVLAVWITLANPQATEMLRSWNVTGATPHAKTATKKEGPQRRAAQHFQSPVVLSVCFGIAKDKQTESEWLQKAGRISSKRVVMPTKMLGSNAVRGESTRATNRLGPIRLWLQCENNGE